MNRMKLVNNMLMQAGRVLVTEALALGAKAGLDTRQMVDVIGKSTGNSVVVKVYEQFTGVSVAARQP